MIFLEEQLPALVLLLVGTLVFGSAPLVYNSCFPKCCSFVSAKEKKLRGLAFLGYLGSGFLFAVSIIFLIPQVHHDLSIHANKSSHSNHPSQGNSSGADASHHDHGHHHHHSFPLPEFCVACGFFVAFLIEIIISPFMEAKSDIQEGPHVGRTKFCSCSQRNIECSRIFKPDTRPAGFGKRKRSATWAGEEKIGEQEQRGSPPDLLQSSLVSRPFPNYGAALTSEPVGLPIRIDGITIVNRPVTLPAPAPLPRIPEFPNGEDSPTFLAPTVASLCLYSVFEGLVIGYQKTTPEMWTMLLAVAIHIFLASFFVGIQSVVEKCSGLKTMMYLLMFSCVAPASVAAAVALANFQYSSILNAIAAGVLLYVSCFERFPRHGKRHSCNQFKFLGTLIGAGIMTSVLYVLT